MSEPNEKKGDWRFHTRAICHTPQHGDTSSYAGLVPGRELQRLVIIAICAVPDDICGNSCGL
jgi:hypothetical protein